jgi:hypothetical protein
MWSYFKSESKPEVVVYVSNPNIWEAETEVLPVQGQPGLHLKKKKSKQKNSESKRKGKKEGWRERISPLDIYSYLFVYMGMVAICLEQLFSHHFFW